MKVKGNADGLRCGPGLALFSVESFGLSRVLQSKWLGENLPGKLSLDSYRESPNQFFLDHSSS